MYKEKNMLLYNLNINQEYKRLFNDYANYIRFISYYFFKP